MFKQEATAVGADPLWGGGGIITGHCDVRVYKDMDYS